MEFSQKCHLEQCNQLNVIYGKHFIALFNAQLKVFQYLRDESDKMEYSVMFIYQSGFQCACGIFQQNLEKMICVRDIKAFACQNMLSRINVDANVNIFFE